MDIYNEEKTIKYNSMLELDFNLGYTKEDILIIHHDEVKEVKEEGHYETLQIYYDEEGNEHGKDVEWVIDQEYVAPVEAYDEEIPIYIYKLYTESELLENKKKKDIENLEFKIKDCIQQLFDTDYKAIKYAEGYYTEDEYAPIKYMREEIRKTIRSLRKDLEKLKEGDSNDAS